MIAYTFLNLLNKLGKRDKMQGFAEYFLAYFSTS